jgi:flagellar hook-associated protein FlgK
MSKVLRKNHARIILVIALSAVVFSAACSKNANTGNSTTTNSGTPNTPTISSGSMSSSPIATVKGYWEAGMKKDVEAAKRYLSTGTIAMLEEGAKKMGKTLDEAFRESANQTPTTEMPEFSNEKITGDTATVDVQMKGMPSVTMPLVKEGGEWKLALDKMIKDMQSSITGSQSKSPGDADDDEAGAGNHNGGH